MKTAELLPVAKCRRRWPRHNVVVPVRILDQIAVQGRGTELNRDGMTIIASDLDCRPGDKLHVEVTLPYSERPIVAPAIVRDRVGDHYGVEFSAETAGDCLRIERIRDLLAMLEHAHQ